MTTITILPEKADSYRALAGDKESTGRTAGEALDALTSQLSVDEGGTLVIVQNFKADEFFNAAQQKRLTELMQLRQARSLSPEEEQELENLVEVELNGARLRTERAAGRPHSETAPPSLIDYEDLVSHHLLVEETLENLVLAQAIAVSSEFAEVIRLHLVEGYPMEEIAKLLGASPAKVRSMYYRNLRRLYYRNLRRLRELVRERKTG